jgi:hypothetical protein
MKTLEEYKNIVEANIPYECNLDDIFFFGKHRNKTISEVIKIDISYLKWCVLNITWFELSKESLRKYNQTVFKKNHFISQKDYQRFLISVLYPETVISNYEWFEESINNKKRILYFLENQANVFDDDDRRKMANIYDMYRTIKDYDYFKHITKIKKRMPADFINVEFHEFQLLDF